jgi:hypothetical protein
MIVSDILEEVKVFCGVNDNATAFVRLTQAIETLTNLSNYDYLIGYADICTATDCGTYTMPRQVDAVLSVNVHNRPALPRNKWYEFHQNGGGSNNSVSWAWDDKFFVPCFQDLLSPSRLMALAYLKNDWAVPITVFGIDVQGNPLRTQNPDGTWQDGVIYPTQLLSDFPYGMPVENQTLFVNRLFSVVPSTAFNVAGHSFISGEQVIFNLVSGPLLSPLTNSGTYFVAVVDANTVELYNSQSNALTGASPIALTNPSSSSAYALTDQRGVSTQTKFNSGSIATNIINGSQVTFSATTLPTPILATSVFYAYSLDSYNFTIHPTYNDAIAGIYPIDVSTPGSSDLTALVRQSMNPITTLGYSVRHDLLQGDIVTITNSGGTYPAPLVSGATYYANILSNYSLTLHKTLSDANSASNPIIITSSGVGNSATLKTVPCTVSTGDKNNVVATGHNLSAGDYVSFQTSGTYPTNITQGTVYQVASPVTANTFTLASLTLAQIGTYAVARTSGVATLTTSLPHGLITGNIVDIESPDTPSFNANQVTITVTGSATFTYSNAGSDVASSLVSTGWVYWGRINITSTGSGQLNLLVSRVFTVGFNSTWNTNTLYLTTGTPVNFATNGSLPSCTPPISSSTTYYARVISANVISIHDTLAHAVANTNAISISSLGSGDQFLSLNRAVTTVLRSQNLNVASSNYLANGAGCEFSTSGTLPSPLNTGTLYKIQNNNDGTIVVLSYSTGLPITLTSVGSGLHDLQISSSGNIILPTELTVTSNELNTGDAVQMLPQDTLSSLPSPFSAGTQYYVRRVDDNTIELFSTYAQAINTSSSAGLIIPTSQGVGNNLLVKEVPAPLVARVDRVRKPITNGLIDLVGWDNKRQTQSPTFIGHYEADEIEPQYRRIKVGVKSGPVRIRFRRRSFQILSVNDWLPFTSAMPILCMVKAMEYLRKDNVQAYEQYKKEADKLLAEEQTAKEGPEGILLQFNDDVFTDSKANWMDNGPWGLGYYG